VKPNNDDSIGSDEFSKEVGYGKPPHATRFKKGVSGNPKGRPKGSLNVATLFAKCVREKVVINEHGRRKKISKLEVAVKQVINKGASGDLRAFHQMRELARDAEAKQNESGVQNPVADELDREVIEGIVKRFKGEEEKSQQPQEVNCVEP
jgi:hypothetical protein